ncbi:hypothetical protein [Metabacillus bambusae]|uniref:IS3 family transposase n=1 Tax=Metabacillus bambusae TaxID=2795218 RepID=A0ABS3N331_9BACI|nr:hypothetical protein [Metabacillus bambusae]MBO1512599.1 hypothetical protein [Metabacillus bambusae]
MSKIIFNEFQRKQLENNPNVNHVSDRSISYKPEFTELVLVSCYPYLVPITKIKNHMK